MENENISYLHSPDNRNYMLQGSSKTKRLHEPLANESLSNKCYELLRRVLFFPSSYSVGVVDVLTKLNTNISQPFFVILGADISLNTMVEHVVDICKSKQVPFIFVPTCAFMTKILHSRKIADVILITYDLDPGMMLEFQDAFVIVRDIWLNNSAQMQKQENQNSWPPLSAGWRPFRNVWPSTDSVRRLANSSNSCKQGKPYEIPPPISMATRWTIRNEEDSININKTLAPINYEMPSFNLTQNVYNMKVGDFISPKFSVNFRLKMEQQLNNERIREYYRSSASQNCIRFLPLLFNQSYQNSTIPQNPSYPLYQLFPEPSNTGCGSFSLSDVLKNMKKNG